MNPLSYSCTYKMAKILSVEFKEFCSSNPILQKNAFDVIARTENHAKSLHPNSTHGSSARQCCHRSRCHHHSAKSSGHTSHCHTAAHLAHMATDPLKCDTWGLTLMTSSHIHVWSRWPSSLKARAIFKLTQDTSETRWHSRQVLNPLLCNSYWYHSRSKELGKERQHSSI